MKAPRDVARSDPWAQADPRALTAPSSAYAIERDLTDRELWEESIARSNRRREARERQLNFGPVSGKRVAVPLAMLAAGLVVRETITTNGDGFELLTAADTQQAHASEPKAAKAQPAAHVKPASHAARQHKATPVANTKPKPDATAKKKPAPKPPAMADGELVRGERGAAIVAIQQKLGVPADGVYGPSTLTAVKTFQKRAGLTVDGRVGPATHAAIARGVPAETAKRTKVASHAAKRPAGNVKSLQQALHVPADGDFGKTTARAVREFQRKHGLKADGVVGPATWEALGIRDPGKTLRQERAQRSQRDRSRGGRAHHARATNGGSVKDLQRALGIPADGVFGRQTAAAVREFQRKHGLKADGVVGPATWAALGVKGADRVLHPRRSGGSSRGRSGSSSRAEAIVARAIAGANRIARAPYRYGGGHASFNDSGYDCSGSVSYVLHAAGLLSAPLNSSAFMTWGAPGPGKHITIYANHGHMFMTINGRRFDTGYGGQGNRWASGSRPTAGYVVRHPPGL